MRHLAPRILLSLAITSISVQSLVAADTTKATAESATSSKADIPLQDIRAFADIFGRIKNDYVEEVSDKDLLESAIRGMVKGLDPHSAFLDAEEFKEIQEGTSGQFGGLGIEVGIEDGYIKIISPIDDTPAQRAGIKAGDVIIRMGGKHAKNMSMEDAVKIMRGDPGTQLEMTILREGAKTPLDFTITRAIIAVASVRARLLENDFAYIRLTQFQAKTTIQMRRAYQRLEQQNKAPIRGLVLDLRNNPGGILDTAISVSDSFLNQGLVVYTEGRLKNSNQKFTATQGDILDGAPMVVLINSGSASASEIVAGALKDHHRAILLGERSFGKGSVQTIQALANGTAIKLTTARYYTPSGISIQATGITPDIKVAELKVSEESGARLHISEADLDGHLNAEQSAKKNAEQNVQPLAVRDYQLFEALNTLKSMALIKLSAQSLYND